MALSEESVKKYVVRLLLSRMRILQEHGFYGLLLMHMIYAVDENIPTACTDGVRITFGTRFLDELSDSELDFVMMHEILHVVLQHCLRGNDLEKERFNIACDIVVNSNILLENGMDKSSVTLRKYGESMHVAPNGREGHEYTAEEVYRMLEQPSGKQKKEQHEGKNGKGSSGGEGSGGQRKSPSQSQKNGNSDRSTQDAVSEDTAKKGNAGTQAGEGNADGRWDDHSRWGAEEENDAALSDLWRARLAAAAEAMAIREANNQRGTVPLCAERLLEKLRKPRTDWHTVLREFVEEEIVDYSFSPPDRRFDEFPFYLPDFSEKDEKVKNVLFMIDTSGSMSDKMIAEAYSEVKGALDQFGGRLSGWLGFFDAEVVPPIPFENEEELSVIRPKGGGGTRFDIIFSYVRDKMEDDMPVSIIVLTDGYAPFPEEEDAMGIPVLWLINNENVTPPWGKVARLLD